jgi:hypothetical protein
MYVYVCSPATPTSIRTNRAGSVQQICVRQGVELRSGFTGRTRRVQMG